MQSHSSSALGSDSQHLHHPSHSHNETARSVHVLQNAPAQSVHAPLQPALPQALSAHCPPQRSGASLKDAAHVPHLLPCRTSLVAHGLIARPSMPAGSPSRFQGSPKVCGSPHLVPLTMNPPPSRGSTFSLICAIQELADSVATVARAGDGELCWGTHRPFSPPHPIGLPPPCPPTRLDERLQLLVWPRRLSLLVQKPANVFRDWNIHPGDTPH